MDKAACLGINSTYQAIPPIGCLGENGTYRASPPVRQFSVFSWEIGLFAPLEFYSRGALFAKVV
ncbi:MAG: hypothetical protein H7095_01300 [Pseudopedobacter sp.]|nr:hypothetical protein [Deinococcales bacterium]